MPENQGMRPHFTPQELELAEVLKAKVGGFFFGGWKNWIKLCGKQP